nr:hypothetical protein [Tanacetum cinerariifolium]
MEAYDGEINLEVEENMISNEYAVKLCLEHKVKRGNKVVKKELIVALRGKIYFVKFIINLEEDDVEPGVIFGRSFLRMTKEIIDFGVGTIIIYPDIDPFLEETKEEEKSNDDWDHLLDFNIYDTPLLGTSSSAGGHLTQEEAAKEALAIRMSQKFALLKEERPIIKRMGYHDKYKKILDEIWKDKVDLDGKIIKEEEEAIERIKGEALKEKDDIGAFIPLKNINWKPDYKDSYTKEEEEVTGKWQTEIRQWEHIMMRLDHHDSNTLDNMKPWRKHWFHKFTMNFCYGKVVAEKLSLAGSDEEIFTSVAWIRAFNINEPIYMELFHEFYSTYEFDEVCADDELQTKKFIKFRLGGRAHSLTLLEFARSDEHFNAQEYWLGISQEENLSLSRSH